MEPKERKFIEVAALKHDLVVPCLEETATAEPIRIDPFKDCPFAILKDILDLADHRRFGELSGKHLSYCLSTDNGISNNLMVRRILRATIGESIRVRYIETCDPVFNYLSRLHKQSFSVQEQMSDRS